MGRPAPHLSLSMAQRIEAIGAVVIELLLPDAGQQFGRNWSMRVSMQTIMQTTIMHLLYTILHFLSCIKI